MTEYLQIHLTGYNTTTADQIETLETSEDFLIYSIPSRETTTMTLVPAGKLRVGAWLVTATGPAELLAIQAVRRPGAYAPLTTSGHLLVNGVAVSSYVSRKWLAPSVVAAGSGNWLHFLQHGAILPWRVFCTVTVFGGCQQEFYDEKTGFSPWVQFWFRVEQWQMSLSKFGQVAFFLLLAAPACLAMLVGKLTVVPLPGDPSLVQYQHIIATLVAVVVWHYLVEKVQSKRRVRSIDHKFQ